MWLYASWDSDNFPSRPLSFNGNSINLSKVGRFIFTGTVSYLQVQVQVQVQVLMLQSHNANDRRQPCITGHIKICDIDFFFYCIDFFNALAIHEQGINHLVILIHVLGKFVHARDSLSFIFQIFAYKTGF
jgi:hypothetical protein